MTPDRLSEIAVEFNNAYRGRSIDLDLTGCELVDIVELALDGMEYRAMTRNRDYFAKPIQGSRSQHDYGRSGPIVSDERRGGWGLAIAITLPLSFVVYGTLWALWTMLP